MRFNSTILEATGLKKVSGDVGIEIETELSGSISSDAVLKAMPNWSLKGDGSLRGHGFEFVTKGALRYNDIEKNVINWRETLDKFKLKVNKSDRTSVHIHKNVQNFTVLNTINAACAYWLLEPYFLDFCGESRKGNNFCLTLQDAGDIHTQLIKGIKQGKPFDNIDENSYRYSSLNLYALYRFGSLEVRLMRGTDKVDEITNWSKAINQTFENAKQFKSPRDIVRKLATDGPESFIKSLLDKDLISFFNSYSRKADYSKIEENALFINDIAESRKSWDFFVDEKKIQEALDSLIEDKIKYLLLLGYPDDTATANTITSLAKNLVNNEAKNQKADIFIRETPRAAVRLNGTRADRILVDDFTIESIDEPEEPLIPDFEEDDPEEP